MNNTIVEEGLSGLAFLWIHSEIIPDIERVIDEFAEGNICLKFALFYWYVTLKISDNTTGYCDALLLKKCQTALNNIIALHYKYWRALTFTSLEKN